ncbi:hypothetical protein Pmani_015488 [Petrolisthes manimaculis]|uniref:Transmembrane protein n=1 Tax=Petrolisthes manimaculis TaxID=1843537 RepID=A0AAE1U9U4_9EUCA|nr:hypothetical protein Pmani_015488 [Petrolisthes manimaculis]
MCHRVNTSYANVSTGCKIINPSVTTTTAAAAGSGDGGCGCRGGMMSVKEDDMWASVLGLVGVGVGGQSFLVF